MEFTELAPGRYFISHSYRDSAAREQLLRFLPSHVEPFIYPAITVQPDEFVSTPLLEAILACHGLIAVSGADSEESFWVTFERNFAQRNKIPTYIWGQVSTTLSRDQPSVSPTIISLSDPCNWSEADHVAAKMRERSFDVVPVWKDPRNRWVPREGNDLRLTSDTRISDPAFVIFISSNTPSAFFYDMVALGQNGLLQPHRVALAFLTTGGPRDLITDFIGSLMLQWGAIVDDLESHMVYLREGVGGALVANRIDDLIVRVSWNMYRERGPVR